MFVPYDSVPDRKHFFILTTLHVATEPATDKVRSRPELKLGPKSYVQPNSADKSLVKLDVVRGEKA
jgi:hypothetical protein